MRLRLGRKFAYPVVAILFREPLLQSLLLSFLVLCPNGRLFLYEL